MNIAARDLWTGDLVVTKGKIITKLGRAGDGDLMRVWVADIVVVPSEPPLEVRNEAEYSFRSHERVEIVRGAPLANGMHMTQLDADGLLHGRAHPALEARYRKDGKLAPDYERR